MSKYLNTPLEAFLILVGWHGTSSTRVAVVGLTPKRFRIRALTRTKLAGRGRWLEVGAEALVPTSAIRHTGRRLAEDINAPGPVPAQADEET